MKARLSLLLLLAFGCGGRTAPDPDPGRRPAAAPSSSTAPPKPPPPTPTPTPTPTPLPPPEQRFAVIGDYGMASVSEETVADLVIGFDPDFVITTGDNNYPSGAAETIDQNIGQYYHAFIAPYRGSYGPGAATNRFFPSLGNHDWATPGAQPYLDYFELPGNERYYDVIQGDVHLFALDSDAHEPDGIASDSVQASWLRQRLTSSSARWKIVYLHHPPYSSGRHGSSTELRWPFREWGASIVYAGHDHHYERFAIDGLPYIVNGAGGRQLYDVEQPQPGSQVAFDDVHGAVLVTVAGNELSSRFVASDGQLLDELKLTAD